MLGVQGLAKEFVGHDGAPVLAIDEVAFEVAQGRFFTLLGPSGCGKSTTLRCVAGLEEPSSGRIAIGEHPVFDSAAKILVPPHRRNIGLLFQSYAIWPHMNVFDNVAYPLKHSRSRSYSRADIRAKVGEVLEIVQMGGYERRPATRLSGGQQQRVALARALVREPSLLLLDEPLSNLDAKLRQEMRIELKRLQNELGVTTVFVTHDQSEALLMSDEIAVMQHGKVVQSGSPTEIYNRPNCRFVATFIGDTNYLDGVVKDWAGTQICTVETDLGLLRGVCRERPAVGDRVGVSIRPENLRLGEPHRAGQANTNRLDARVELSMFLGRAVDYSLVTGNGRLKAESRGGKLHHEGDQVQVEFDPEDCVVIVEG